MKVKEIQAIIERVAPKSLAMDFDHVGLQVGDAEQEVNSVLVALDLTEAVLEEAIRKKADFIITHHPYFFHPVFSVTNETARGRMIMRLIENKISYYAAHTNMDIAFGGINDKLCDLLQLQNCSVLEFTTEKEGLGRIGTLNEAMKAEEFLLYVKKCLNAERICFSGKKESIQKVAVCGGSGTSSIDLALACGADAFITADMKYATAQELCEKPILLVDAGHFGTENCFCDIICQLLSGFVKVQKAESNVDLIGHLTF